MADKQNNIQDSPVVELITTTQETEKAQETPVSVPEVTQGANEAEAETEAEADAEAASTVSATESETTEVGDKAEVDDNVSSGDEAEVNKKAKRIKRRVKKIIKTKETHQNSEALVAASEVSEDRGVTLNPEYAALVDSVYNKVFLKIRVIIEQGVTLSNIVIIIDTTMRTVGKLQNLSGSEKKELTIAVVHKILEVCDLKEEDRAALLIVTSTMLDPLIDQIFEIAPKLYGKVKAHCLSLSCCKKQ